MKNALRLTHLNIAHNKRYKTKQCCNKNLSLFILLIISITIATGCGTTKQFLIQSNPEGALIIMHDKTKFEDSYSKSYHGETPSQKKVSFYKDEHKYFTIEKRGYHSASQSVTSESDPTLLFNLDKIEGASEKIFPINNLQSGTFLLLPPYIEVFIHSGVGRLDEIDKSDEKSKIAMNEFYIDLKKMIDENNNKQIICLPAMETTIEDDWKEIHTKLNQYLQKLDAKRLKYYSLPPLINENVKEFKTVAEKINNKVDSEKQYLLYIKGKCISETTGRKVGNFIGSVLGPVFSAYHDPKAFNTPDNTKMTLFVIDTKTSEVLFIEPIDFIYTDISDDPDLKRLSAIFSKYPNIYKKKK